MIDGYYAVDYQVHSLRSHDGRATIAEQCERAAALGLDEIGFSEHKDFDPADPGVNYFDYEAYMTEIEAARDRWEGSLIIRAGVEIDYQARFENKIGSFLDNHEFDFVLGSVHYVGGAMLMTPEYNCTRTRDVAYRDYFAAVADSISTGLFDVLAHLEYANRRGLAAWGLYDPAHFRTELNQLFAMMVERNMPLEINTAGLHQGLGLTYPTAETVAMFAAQGGTRISIGSDAHHPDQLAHAYALAARIAQNNGIARVCTWHRRQAHDVPLQQVAD
jgi:histidinol-phosphatase (PHP family)